jgi:hypothetical protein
MAADPSRFAVMISHERSGSHFLTDMLTSTDRVRSLDEVCNFNAVDPDISKASFFRFRHESAINAPEFALRPSSETMTTLLDLYLEHLDQLVKPGKIIWLDIKYGHVHNFEIGWWPTERRPFLLNYLETREIRVVHLTRRDSIAATISSLIAEKTGAWHRRDGSAGPSISRVHVPIIRAVQEALMLEREKDNFFSWLANNRRFAVVYEDIAALPEIRDGVLKELCRFLGIPPPDTFATSHQKVTPPLSDVLENFEDLRRVAHIFGGGRLILDSSEAHSSTKFTD